MPPVPAEPDPDPGPDAVPAPPRRYLATGVGAGLILALVVPLGVVARRAPVPTTSAPTAASVLEAAADAAESAPATTPPPGRMRYVAARQVTLEAVPDGRRRSHLVRTGMLTEEWIPADPGQPWTQHVRDDGPPQIWDERTRSYADAPPAPASSWSARCGAYYPAPGEDPCRRPGLWQDPTPAFVAGLPRDPAALLARLRADTSGGDDQEVLAYAAQALSRDLLPPHVRATVYRALALLPGLTVTEPRFLLGGRTGTALGLDRDGARLDIVVDDTGAYLGSVRRLTAPRDGLAAGTVTDTTAITTGVARRGETP